MFIKKEIIRGCESRGDGDIPYLTRWILFECKAFKICLHKFHRSDADDLHDHPWNFLTIPLWRGYIEQTPVYPKCWECGEYLTQTDKGYCMCTNNWCINVEHIYIIPNYNYKRIYPFIPKYRSAKHLHRVILINEKPAWTLIIMGKRYRIWGFIHDGKWTNFLNYFKINKC